MAGAAPDVPDLRTRTRRAVRAGIAEAATGLFLAQGFDATTMDQIAAEAGLSRRSLFRYFSTKEDVVLGGLVEAGLVVRDALEARPPGERPWEALRAALASLVPDAGHPAARTLEVSKMLYGTPSLRAAHLEKQLRWQDLLVPDVQRRLGRPAGGEPDPRARAIVACALTCLDIATETWTRYDGRVDPVELYDRAVAAVRA